MTRFDCVIRNGTVVTASDTFMADVGIVDGRITALGSGLEKGTSEVDASGRLVMPGGIDSHVHISQPSGKAVMADDFSSASRAAAFGGTTTVMPFVLPEDNTSLREAVIDYHALAKDQCAVDYAFHLIVARSDPQTLGQDLPALIADGYTSIKVYMTYDGLKLSDYELLKVMDVARRERAQVMVHAENDGMIQYLTERLEAEGITAPIGHARSRPMIAEREATQRAVSLSELIDVPLTVVHVSHRAAMEEIRKAQALGLNVTAETCPQYLVLTEADLEGLNMEGEKLVCSPPPRDVDAQEACWSGLQQGVLKLYSSDHAPFRWGGTEGKRPGGKRTAFRWVPNGLPGIETRLPILFSEGVVGKRISVNQFVAVTATNHARHYGLASKGTIAPGFDADIAIWNPSVTQTIQQANLHHGADYTPYEGLSITGWPEAVFLRGTPLIQDGQLLRPNAGRFISRTRAP